MRSSCNRVGPCIQGQLSTHKKVMWRPVERRMTEAETEATCPVS